MSKVEDLLKGLRNLIVFSQSMSSRRCSIGDQSQNVCLTAGPIPRSSSWTNGACVLRQADLSSRREPRGLDCQRVQRSWPERGSNDAPLVGKAWMLEQIGFRLKIEETVLEHMRPPLLGNKSLLPVFIPFMLKPTSEP